MNSTELRDLLEAYSEVYTSQEVDEATAMAKSKKQKAMEDPHTGINSPAFEKFMRQQMGR